MEQPTNQHHKAAMRHMIKGFAIMAIGLVIILQTLGWIQTSFNIIFIIIGLGAIFYGFVISGLYEKVVQERKKQS